MTKRVIDSLTGVSLTMKIEDRGADATLILEHAGSRIETKVAGSDHIVPFYQALPNFECKA